MGLVIVMLLTTTMSSLTAALIVSSNMETLIARNHQTAAQARAAAEAGLSHGLEVAISYLRVWMANGFASPSAAMTDLLDGPDDSAMTRGDNGSLAELALPLTPQMLGDLSDVTYLVRVFDDDDAAGRGITLSADDISERLHESPSTPYLDANSRIVVRAIGHASGGATAVLEATIGPASLPAIVTKEKLRIDGYATIDGSNGGVHSNGDLEVDGNAVITEDATASGSFSVSGAASVGGRSAGGEPEKWILAIHARDYRAHADYVLTVDGRITDSRGSLICDASVATDACVGAYGWEFTPDPDPHANGWRINNDEGDYAPGTYYVEGRAAIAGDPGSMLMPLRITVLAEGSIDVSGSPDLQPDTPYLMFVTDGDLRISSGLRMAAAFPGAMLVREQVRILGDAILFGQIICEGADDASDLVEENEINGNMRLTYDGTGAPVDFAVLAWRRTP